MTNEQLHILLLTIDRGFVDAHNKTSTRLQGLSKAFQASDAIKNKYLTEALSEEKMNELETEILEVTMGTAMDIEENADLLSPIREQLENLHNQINLVSSNYLPPRKLSSSSGGG